MANAQAAAWPATSYSPYFQNLFAQASAPVAALPSGPGAMAPAIPASPITSFAPATIADPRPLAPPTLPPAVTQSAVRKDVLTSSLQRPKTVTPAFNH
ncbi:hypothetical protein M3Y99_01137800 [Aphelenchoides fujianensis]|nr:hypothetical protein M3Y99_01137800 [Aphelenchoides fujianensis]